MENLIKISCNNTTYVDKFHSHTNFSESNSLLIGAVTHESLGLNLYMSILNFHISDLKLDSIEEAYLFLFIEDIKYTHNSSENFGILGSFENVDISTIDWFGFPKNNLTRPLTLSIPDNPIGSYLKIDITSLIKSLANYDIDYNIILIPLDTNSNAIVKLASSRSNNPPYLNIVTYSTDSAELSEASETETYDEEIEKNTYESTSSIVLDNITSQKFLENMITSILNNLEKQNSILDFIKSAVSNDKTFVLTENSLNKVNDILINEDSKLDSYNNSLNDKINFFSKKLDNIDIKIETLDYNITNSMQNSTEILNSNVSSLNSDILKLGSILHPLFENVEILKNNSDSQLLELSSNLNSLIKMINSITIEPLN